MSDSEFPVLPGGWVWTELGSIGHVFSGGTPSTDRADFYGGDIPWITPADLTGYSEKYIPRGRRSITKDGLASSSAVIIPAGSILFSSRAPIGYLAIAANPVSTNQGFKSLSPSAEVCSDYVYYYLMGSRRLAERHASGTTFLELSKARFERLPFPICPLPEQRRIVAKIEELFTRLDAGVEALERVQVLLERYRQSVLKEAFEGRLTAAWREAHRDELEPASVLLERIRRQREAAGSTKGRHQRNAIPSLDASYLPELPREWQWVRLGHCLQHLTKGESPGWQGFDYVGESDGVVFIRSENVRWGTLDNSTVVRIPEAFHNKLQRSQVRPNDVLVNLVGASIGRCALVPSTTTEANINQAVALLRTNHALLPGYLTQLMLSPYVQGSIEHLKVETARPNISLSNLRELAIPLPPVTEQYRVCEELERRLSILDSIARSTHLAAAGATRLRQSILRRAFEGRLVPQDPTDEPAEMLLARIRVARQEQGRLL